MALIALYILKICYLCKSKTIINGKLIFTQQLIKTSIMVKAKFFCAAVVMAFMAVIPASAQGVAFGVKGGVNFTKMSIGAMLSKHLEIGATYSLGISKTGELETEVDKAKANNNELKPKSSSWEIGITCFF